MSSLIFLFSMALVIYLLLQGDKQDKIDRQQSLETEQTTIKQGKPK